MDFLWNVPQCRFDVICDSHRRALGIGGASTVFSVVNAMLLRPLPFRDPGQLVWISNAENYSTQAEHYSDLRDQNQSFSDLAGWAWGSTIPVIRN